MLIEGRLLVKLIILTPQTKAHFPKLRRIHNKGCVMCMICNIEQNKKKLHAEGKRMNYALAQPVVCAVSVVAFYRIID